MMYILTQEEYDKLTTERKYEIEMSKDALQKLCTKIANETPAFVNHKGQKVPWSCILNDNEISGMGYCDGCLVQEICPYEFKEWSN